MELMINIIKLNMEHIRLTIWMSTQKSKKLKIFSTLKNAWQISIKKMLKKRYELQPAKLLLKADMSCLFLANNK